MKRKNKVIILGIILVIIGIVFVTIEVYPKKIIQKEEKEALRGFKENDNQTIVESTIENKELPKPKDINYIATIKIPKINLEKGIVGKESEYNNIEYGIEVLEESDMPDVENGDLILASHSGNSNVSHFKNLNKLELNDIVEIRYKNSSYLYKVIDIYEIDKIGEIRIEKEEVKKTLTLVTCKENTDKQIVIRCDLI